MIAFASRNELALMPSYTLAEYIADLEDTRQHADALDYDERVSLWTAREWAADEWIRRLGLTLELN